MNTILYSIDNRCYINICSKCTLQCNFCPKTHDNSYLHGYNLALDKSPNADEVIKVLKNHHSYAEYVFCGFGEPTLRLPVLLTVAQWLKSNQGIVRLNTDGLANLVYKRNIIPALAKVIDKVSVSMNAHNEEVYQQHCQPRLIGAYQSMLSFLLLSVPEFSQVTATAIEGLKGVDINACEKLACQLGVHFRKRQLNILG